MEKLSIQIAQKKQGKYEDYSKNIIEVIGQNQKKAKDLLLQNFPDSFLAKNIETIKNIYDTTGSLKTTFLPQNPVLKDFFNENDIHESRYFVEGKNFILRGADYILSLNPNFKSGDKLHIIRDIFKESIVSLKKINFFELDENDKIWYMGLVDYAKNCLITLYNSLIIPEKKGKKDNDEQYELLKISLQDDIQVLIDIYYGVLLLDENFLAKKIEELKSINEKIFNGNTQYLSEKLYYTKFSRPEAIHPLTILSSSGLIIQDKKDYDMVISLPGGSTEVGFVAKFIFNNVLKKDIELKLVPISFHSGKIAYSGDENISDAQIKNNFFDSINGSGKKIIVIDDNSSTGKTLQYLYEILLSDPEKSPKELRMYVTEADLIRSKIDWDNHEKRPTIPSPNVYTFATNILPVSSYISKKFDIKELIEMRRLTKFYNQKPMENGNIILQLQQQTLSDPTYNHIKNKDIDFGDKDQVEKEQQESNSIVLFRDSFLSNFYPVDVKFDGVDYPSVEHAYQAQKYEKGVFGKLTPSQLDELNEALKNKGHSIQINPKDPVFSSRYFTSGNIKVISTYLDKWGYGKKTWSQEKFGVMFNLLEQKYSDPKLAKRLLETGDKYLIEGNTWGDIFWGFSGGEGANFLGRSLMLIRENLKNNSEK